MSDVAGTWVTIHPRLDREELRAELESIDDNKLIRIGANATEAKAQIDDVNARLRAFSRQTAAASIRLGGVEETNAKLGGIFVSLEKLNHTVARPKVEVDTKGAQASLGGLFSWLVALGPAAVPLGATLAGSFASLPALFGGASLGVMALGGGLTGLTKTLKDYSAANTNSNQSAATAHSQLVTLNADMLKLPPAARDVVGVIEGQLVPAWHQFAQADQAALFGSAKQGIADLIPMFHDIAPYALTAAHGMGSFFSSMGQWSTSAQGLHDINTILGEGNQLFGSLANSGQKVFIALANIGAQRAEFGPLGQSIDHVATAFLHWTQDGGSMHFLQYVHDVTPEVRQFFDELGHTVSTLAQAWAPLGPLWLSSGTELLHVADAFAKLNPWLIQAIPFVLLGSKAFSAWSAATSAMAASGALAKIGTLLGSGGIAGAAGQATTRIGAITNALGLLALRAAIPMAATLIVYEILKPTSAGAPTAADAKGTFTTQQMATTFGSALPQGLTKKQQAWYQEQLALASNYIPGEKLTVDSKTGKAGVSLPGHSPAQMERINYLMSQGVSGKDAVAIIGGGKLTPKQWSERNAAFGPGGTGLPPTSQNPADPYAASVPGSGTGRTPGTLSPAQQLAQTLTGQVNSMLGTLGGLGMPAKNAVTAQQQALRSNAPQLDNLISRIVGSHQSALMPLVPELKAAHTQAVAQLVQLQKAQGVTLATTGITAAANANTSAARAASTKIADDLAIRLQQQLTGRGGSTAVTRAQLGVDTTQRDTDVRIAAAQDQVDAAAAHSARVGVNGTPLQQAEAARSKAAADKQLSDAQADQQTRLAVANAQLQAAQAEEAAAVQLEQTSATIATDVGNAMSTMISALSTIAIDVAAMSTDAVTAATSAMADTSAARVQAIMDQSQIAIDQLNERGLNGFALQAAQAKTALDELTATYNQQIGAIRVQNDNANAQQTALVDRAKVNLDNVTASTQQKVNEAQAAYDATLNSNDSVAQATAARNLAEARADQQVLVARASADYDAARATAQAIQALGAQALQGVQDQAAEAEAERRAIYDHLVAQANGSGGTVFNVEINGVPNAISGVDAMMFELKAAGAL